jgi:hypothetical protein
VSLVTDVCQMLNLLKLITEFKGFFMS